MNRVPLLLLLAVGGGLRVYAMFAYRPAVLVHTDSIGYLDAASSDPFRLALQPAGYPLFLRAVAELVAHLWVTIALQHVLGLVAALLLYSVVRRAGGPVWTAIMPAAVVLLAGDQIFLEHAIMSESLFVGLVAGSLYAAVRSLDGSPAFAVAAGGLAATAGVTRSVGLALAPVVVVWLLVAPSPRDARTLGTAAMALAGAVVVLGAYAAAQLADRGTVSLGGSGGWALYSRVAVFADCNDFQPPAGTARLCEKRAPPDRPGPNFYGWNPLSPARRLYGYPPNGNDELLAFARAAILAQPLDYATTVGTDLVRYVVPGFGRRRLDERPEGMSFARRAPLVERTVEDRVDRFYAPVTLERTGLQALIDYQRLIRVHGSIILIFAVLSLVGAVAASGVARRTVWLAGVFALVLLVVPSATTDYTARYAVPAAGPLAVAAALGLRAAMGSLQARGRGRDSSAASNSSVP